MWRRVKSRRTYTHTKIHTPSTDTHTHTETYLHTHTHTHNHTHSIGRHRLCALLSPPTSVRGRSAAQVRRAGWAMVGPGVWTVGVRPMAGGGGVGGGDSAVG